MVACLFWVPVLALALVLALVLALKLVLGWWALQRAACLFSPQALVSARVACLLWRAQAQALVLVSGQGQVLQAGVL